MVVGDTYVFPGFLTPVLTQLFLPRPLTTFPNASADVRGKNTPERKVASTEDRTHNHQVMSPKRSPLSLLCQNLPQSNFLLLIFPVFFPYGAGNFVPVLGPSCGTKMEDLPHTSISNLLYTI